MRLLFFLSSVIVWFGAAAQQEPLISNYTFNILSYNPAFAGAKKGLVASALYNRQFTGLPSGTVFQNFAVHAPISYHRWGLGATVYSFKQDVLMSSVYNAHLSYKIKIYKGYLSMGLSAGFYYQKIDRYNLQIEHVEDPTLREGANSWTSPDIGAGLFYWDAKNMLALSARHLFSNFKGSGQGVDLAKHYYLIMGRTVTLSHDVSAQLATKVRYAQGASLQADLSGYVVYKERGKAGVSYRTVGSLSFQISMAFDMTMAQVASRFHIGYAYDYSLHNYQKQFGGSHEVLLSMELSSLKRPGNDKPVISPLMF